jgi:hypothetical protein
MPPPKEILTQEQLLRIASGGLAELEHEWTSDDDAFLDRDSGRRQMAFEALRCAAAVAVWRPEPEVVPLLVRALPLSAGGRRETWVTDLDIIAQGIRRLVVGVPQSPTVLRSLSLSKSAAIRLAVVSGLEPEGEEQIAILRERARDTDPKISHIAREKLGARFAPPWWEGVFPRDPLAGLTPQVAADIGPRLERTVALIQAPGDKMRGGKWDELVMVISELPQRLALQAVMAYFRRTDAFAHVPTCQKLALMLLDLDSDGREAAGLVARWGKDEKSGAAKILKLGEFLAEGDPARRQVLCLKLIPLIQDKGGNTNPTIVLYLPKTIGKLWPAEADPRPVLEAILSVTLEEAEALLEGEEVSSKDEGVVHWRADLVEKCQLDLGPHLDLLVRVHEAGYPGLWSRIAGKMSLLLGQLRDPRLRRVAERKLFSGEKPSPWALAYLIGPGYDPERDVPPREFLRRALSDPKLRPVVFQTKDLLFKVLHEARAELRAGTLTPEEVKAVVEATNDLWGDSGAPPPSYIAEELPARRAALAAELAPDQIPGHLDPEERVVVRRSLLPEILELKGHFVFDFSYFPPSTRWTEEDRTYFEGVLGKIIETWRTQKNERQNALELMVLTQIEQQPHEIFLPFIDEIIARPREQVDFDSLDYAKGVRRKVREALGLDPDEPPPEPKERAQPSDWLDESDEDDDEGV